MDAPPLPIGWDATPGQWSAGAEKVRALLSGKKPASNGLKWAAVAVAVIAGAAIVACIAMYKKNEDDKKK